MPPNKTRSLVRRFKKKRKFYGSRKQDSSTRGGPESINSSRPGPTTGNNQPSSSTPKRELKSHTNSTAKKLQNSSFDKLESPQVLTRNAKKKLGLSKEKKRETAEGYAILDMSLLQDALQSAVICRSCKSPY